MTVVSSSSITTGIPLSSQHPQQQHQQPQLLLSQDPTTSTTATSTTATTSTGSKPNPKITTTFKNQSPSGHNNSKEEEEEEEEDAPSPSPVVGLAALTPLTNAWHRFFLVHPHSSHSHPPKHQHHNKKLLLFPKKRTSSSSTPRTVAASSDWSGSHTGRQDHEDDEDDHFLDHENDDDDELFMASLPLALFSHSPSCSTSYHPSPLSTVQESLQPNSLWLSRAAKTTTMTTRTSQKTRTTTPASSSSASALAWYNPTATTTTTTTTTTTHQPETNHLVHNEDEDATANNEGWACFPVVAVESAATTTSEAASSSSSSPSSSNAWLPQSPFQKDASWEVMFVDPPEAPRTKTFSSRHGDHNDDDTGGWTISSDDNANTTTTPTTDDSTTTPSCCRALAWSSIPPTTTTTTTTTATTTTTCSWVDDPTAWSSSPTVMQWTKPMVVVNKKEQQQPQGQQEEAEPKEKEDETRDACFSGTTTMFSAFWVEDDAPSPATTSSDKDDDIDDDNDNGDDEIPTKEMSSTNDNAAVVLLDATPTNVTPFSQSQAPPPPPPMEKNKKDKEPKTAASDPGGAALSSSSSPPTLQPPWVPIPISTNRSRRRTHPTNDAFFSQHDFECSPFDDDDDDEDDEDEDDENNTTTNQSPIETNNQNDQQEIGAEAVDERSVRTGPLYDDKDNDKDKETSITIQTPPEKTDSFHALLKVTPPSFFVIHHNNDNDDEEEEEDDGEGSPQAAWTKKDHDHNDDCHDENGSNQGNHDNQDKESPSATTTIEEACHNFDDNQDQSDEDDKGNAVVVTTTWGLVENKENEEESNAPMVIVNNKAGDNSQTNNNNKNKNNNSNNAPCTFTNIKKTNLLEMKPVVRQPQRNEEQEQPQYPEPQSQLQPQHQRNDPSSGIFLSFLDPKQRPKQLQLQQQQSIQRDDKTTKQKKKQSTTNPKSQARTNQFHLAKSLGRRHSLGGGTSTSHPNKDARGGTGKGYSIDLLGVQTRSSMLPSRLSNTTDSNKRRTDCMTSNNSSFSVDTEDAWTDFASSSLGISPSGSSTRGGESKAHLAGIVMEPTTIIEWNKTPNFPSSLGHSTRDVPEEKGNENATNDTTNKTGSNPWRPSSPTITVPFMVQNTTMGEEPSVELVSGNRKAAMRRQSVDTVLPKLGSSQKNDDTVDNTYSPQIEDMQDGDVGIFCFQETVTANDAANARAKEPYKLKQYTVKKCAESHHASDKVGHKGNHLSASHSQQNPDVVGKSNDHESNIALEVTHEGSVHVEEMSFCPVKPSRYSPRVIKSYSQRVLGMFGRTLFSREDEQSKSCIGDKTVVPKEGESLFVATGKTKPDPVIQSDRQDLGMQSTSGASPRSPLVGTVLSLLPIKLVHDIPSESFDREKDDSFFDEEDEEEDSEDDILLGLDKSPSLQNWLMKESPEITKKEVDSTPSTKSDSTTSTKTDESSIQEHGNLESDTASNRVGLQLDILPDKPKDIPQSNVRECTRKEPEARIATTTDNDDFKVTEAKEPLPQEGSTAPFTKGPGPEKTRRNENTDSKNYFLSSEGRSLVPLAETFATRWPELVASLPTPLGSYENGIESEDMSFNIADDVKELKICPVPTQDPPGITVDSKKLYELQQMQDRTQSHVDESIEVINKSHIANSTDDAVDEHQEQTEKANDGVPVDDGTTSNEPVEYANENELKEIPPQPSIPVSVSKQAKESSPDIGSGIKVVSLIKKSKKDRRHISPLKMMRRPRTKNRRRSSTSPPKWRWRNKKESAAALETKSLNGAFSTDDTSNGGALETRSVPPIKRTRFRPQAKNRSASQSAMFRSMASTVQRSNKLTGNDVNNDNAEASEKIAKVDEPMTSILDQKDAATISTAAPIVSMSSKVSAQKTKTTSTCRRAYSVPRDITKQTRLTETTQQQAMDLRVVGNSSIEKPALESLPKEENTYIPTAKIISVKRIDPIPCMTKVNEEPRKPDASPCMKNSEDEKGGVKKPDASLNKTPLLASQSPGKPDASPYKTMRPTIEPETTTLKRRLSVDCTPQHKNGPVSPSLVPTFRAMPRPKVVRSRSTDDCLGLSAAETVFVHKTALDETFVMEGIEATPSGVAKFCDSPIVNTMDADPRSIPRKTLAATPEVKATKLPNTESFESSCEGGFKTPVSVRDSFVDRWPELVPPSVKVATASKFTSKSTVALVSAKRTASRWSVGPVMSKTAELSENAVVKMGDAVMESLNKAEQEIAITAMMSEDALISMGDAVMGGLDTLLQSRDKTKSKGTMTSSQPPSLLQKCRMESKKSEEERKRKEAADVARSSCIKSKALKADSPNMKPTESSFAAENVGPASRVTNKGSSVPSIIGRIETTSSMTGEVSKESSSFKVASRWNSLHKSSKNSGENLVCTEHNRTPLVAIKTNEAYSDEKDLKRSLFQKSSEGKPLLMKKSASTSSLFRHHQETNGITPLALQDAEQERVAIRTLEQLVFSASSSGDGSPQIFVADGDMAAEWLQNLAAATCANENENNNVAAAAAVGFDLSALYQEDDGDSSSSPTNDESTILLQNNCLCDDEEVKYRQPKGELIEL